MPRSLKKGPFIEESLLKKITAMNERGEKRVVKTWSRSSTVIPAITCSAGMGRAAPRIKRTSQVTIVVDRKE